MFKMERQGKMPLEQHPVPQQISAYQFRLVGDMTLKQFGLLSLGCIAALIVHSLPMVDFFKWSLIIFFVFCGFALAFLPIQERPLEKWIVAFIKAIFSPAQYVWKKEPHKLAIFETSVKTISTQKAPIPRGDRKQLTEYLQTLPTEPQSPLDQQEENFVKKALNMFQLIKIPSPAPQFQPSPPLVKTVIEKPIPKAPVSKPKPAPKPKVAKSIKKETAPRPKRLLIRLPGEPSLKKKATMEAKSSSDLPFPEPPSQPNTLVGMVLDRIGRIIENAIIEIRNNKGVPVRALKSNKLGQFRSVTPLDNGQYEIEIEKPGYRFDVLKINLSGAIIEPLEIRAKEKINEPAQNT